MVLLKMLSMQHISTNFAKEDMSLAIVGLYHIVKCEKTAFYAAAIYLPFPAVNSQTTLQGQLAENRVNSPYLTPFG